jgi:hypothetical protein
MIIDGELWLTMRDIASKLSASYAAIQRYAHRHGIDKRKIGATLVLVRYKDFSQHPKYQG